MVAKALSAFIFPGQGAQYVGMGRDLYEAFQECREVFADADRVLNFPLSKLCFQGPVQELTRTLNCQPAIFTVSIACLKALSRSSNLQPAYMAGLSLGEYTALVASGALSFEQGLLLVAKRARFMEEAASRKSGRMASILGLDLDKVEEIAQDSGAEIANLNCPGQVVISGSPEAIERAGALSLERGAKRAITLEVNGAFHSSFMQPASRMLQEAIAAVEIRNPQVPVVSNVNAAPETEPGQIKENLVKQLTSSVFWEKSVRFMIARGASRFFEVGPGKVLKGLIRKIDSNAEVVNIGNKEDIDKLAGGAR